MSFCSAFHGAWLAATRSIANTSRRNQLVEPHSLLSALREGDEITILPGQPYLHRVFETDVSRQNAGVIGRFRHQQSDQVVSEKVNQDFFVRHGGALATEYVHAERGLDVAQVQFDMPPGAIQFANRLPGRLLWAAQRGDQYPALRLNFANRQRRGKSSVVLLAHPIRSRRLDPLHQMILDAQFLAAAEVNMTMAIASEEDINAMFL